MYNSLNIVCTLKLVAFNIVKGLLSVTYNTLLIKGCPHSEAY